MIFTTENMDSRLRGNDKPSMIDSSRSLNLSCFFVFVGLDPTIQKIASIRRSRFEEEGYVVG
jgi:hypothetical protein